MPNLSQIAEQSIHKLMWEERGRLGAVASPWGPPVFLSRKGGWVVLSKGMFDLPTLELVELGKSP